MKRSSRYLSWPRVAVAIVASTALYMGLTLAASPNNSIAPTPSLAAVTASTLKPSTCATDALTKNGATCYEFTGEENWDHPNGETVTLPVAVFPGSVPQLAPVFYFPGGPGGTSVGSSENTLQARLERVKPRTLVFVEMRGTLHAKPALQCPGFNEIHHWYRQFAPDVYDPKGLDARIKQQVDYVKGCYKKLTNEGIDVTQYTDYQITRDYDEIRKALGFETINIWGVSTGGGTVESYVKYYGSHTRAAIFEVPWFNHLRNRPPIGEFHTEKQIAIDMLGICVRDNEECARRLPDYMRAVDRARAVLDAKPYRTTVTTETGDQREVRINGTTFLSHLFYGYFEFDYHLLPKVLEGIKRGDYSVLDEFLHLDDVDRIVPTTTAFGHQQAVMCGDQGKNRPTPEEAVAMIRHEPALMGAGTPVPPFCAWWGADGDAPPNLNTPTVSDAPALAIHGQLDTCCNIRWSQLLAQTMPKLQRVEIQAQGHGGLQDPCRRKLFNAFLNSPDVKVDDSCKDDIPLEPWVFYDG